MRRADNLTTFMYRLSLNLGGSNSWNPQGLSRSVIGLLYLFTVPEYSNKDYSMQSESGTTEEESVILFCDLVKPNFLNC